MADQTVLVRIARQARIVGGTFAEKGEFPYHVALSYHDEFVCGGSILSTLLILTAAHCVKYKRPNKLTVTAGAHDRSRSGSGSEQIRTARYIYMHENYVWETDVNDIAIIVLNTPLQYTSYVKNISLPAKGEEFYGYANVVGWGRTQEKGETSNILRKVKLPLISQRECHRRYSKVKMKVTDNMICAGEINKDACQGDSGGSAVCKTNELEDSKSLVICGVVSHGYGCGRAGFPGVYTKVSNYIDWIENTRQKIVARGKCRTDHFYCSSGCIPRALLCDLETDCQEDGEDERSCIYMTSCRRNQFRCNNGRCIKREYTCDDMDDCGDRSDEDKCPTETKICMEGQHQCGSVGRCIPNEWKCDNEQDCDDNSDEENCVGSTGDYGTQTNSSSSLKPDDGKITTTTPAPCSADQFFCSRDYRCIPQRWRCDGDRDCRSGIDEIGCSFDDGDNTVDIGSTTTAAVITTNRPRPTTTGRPHYSTRATTKATIVPTTATTIVGQNLTTGTTKNETEVCSRNQFRCDNGECIANVFQCDYDDDCGDGSDERNCHLIVFGPTCSAYFWQCGDGECIYHRFRCDGDLDCKNKRDEMNCEENNEGDENKGNINNMGRPRRRKGKSSRRG